MDKKEELKLCLDEIGHILQMIATMENKIYTAVIGKGTDEEKTIKTSYQETVQDLADIANVQFLDQLYSLLEIESEMEEAK